jgi:hypothetical protein
VASYQLDFKSTPWDSSMLGLIDLILLYHDEFDVTHAH